MRKIAGFLLSAALVFSLSACSGRQADTSENNPSSIQGETTQEGNEMNENIGNQETNAKGGMSTEDALEYMKQTENLVIVDVATAGRYEKEHFEGAINIPIEELDSGEEDARYMEIPEGRPVLVHCRLGMIAPGAYERVLELRSDIPEISYIDGVPPFEEYNEWKSNQ